MIKDKLEELKEAISDYKDVTIIAACKYTDAEGVLEVVESGVNNIGINRVNDLLEKQEALSENEKAKDIVWHFIGTLQTKQVKNCINNIDFLHSLDNLKLAKEIEKRRETELKCFVEVNISGEDTKQGLDPEDVEKFLENIKDFTKIKVIGLMTMAPFTKDRLVITSIFNKLKNLQEDLKKRYSTVSELSMGMSNDYLIALDCGSNYLRIGRMLFSE